MLEILCASFEFESISIRDQDWDTLEDLNSQVLFKQDEDKLNTYASKANLLLQAHFSRIDLTADLTIDQKLVIEKSLKLVQALVDVAHQNELYQ